MSSLLNVEGKEYTAATVAGKRFGYTKDYLLLLIKNGKIDGKKIGNKWYVHIPSAELFFKQAEEKRKARRAQVSEERKLELREHVSGRMGGHHRTALVETLAILVIGLSLGATGYVGATAEVAAVSGSDLTFLERLAVSFYEAFDDPSGTVPEPADDASQGDHDGGNAVVSSLIVAPDAVLRAETVDSLRESFSDPVDVTLDPLHPDTGIVTPEFKNSESEAYRFLMVPVRTE